MFRKEYSIKITDYFKINKPNYIYLKLISNTSVRNRNTSDIAAIINNCYKSILDRFENQNKGFSYSVPNKISFIIDITNESADFYMLIPDVFVNEFKQKITEVFGKITIEESEPLKINKECTQYSLGYKKDDSFSLAVDKRDNDLLTANLSIMDILKDDDRVTIVYNFMPLSKYALNTWSSYHKDMIKKYKQGACMDKEFNIKKIFKLIIQILFDIIDSVVEAVQMDFSDSKSNKNKDSLYTRLVPVQELTKATIKKENANIINTQILLYSQSKDIKREEDNAKTLINTYKSISSDNELVAKNIGIKKKYKKNDTVIGIERNESNSKVDYVNLETYSFDKANQSRISSEECSNFISLPGRELIDEYKLEAVQTVETIVPDELKNGNVCIGENTYRGIKTKTTLSSNEDAACMPMVIMGKMGGGKSTLFENMGVDSIKHGEGLIVIDFIKNCEMSENIIKNIPKEKVITIDFTDYKNLQGFGFNEINHLLDPKDAMSRYVCASLQTVQICNFIDNLGDEELSAIMEMFLDAACTAVLIHPDKAIKDIVACLSDFQIRYQYINDLNDFKENMPEEYREIIQEKMNTLRELNEVDKKTNSITGTKYSKIEGILTRINKLKKNHLLEFMYVKSTTNNIDLVKCMQEGKAIFFKMPQYEVSSPQVKNVIVSYIMSKIMIASEVRSRVYANEKLRIVNVICDELQQARGSFVNVEQMSYQMRKFRVRLTISTHGFHKIAPIKDTLIEAGSSIMLLKGSSPKNFEVMEDEFKKFGFTKEDLTALSHTEEYKALSLIATKKGRYGVITKLPAPVKNKIEVDEYKEPLTESAS